ncbi:latent-transforming growth factor beta-binding protein 1-like isoform X2 [Symsagittifera roscoffensis]|uniref:latent-transforming growth factor beta-binding protein 1-like isoform X2 n=1 Tax=Symsagittifera roscoffensis TaxID=84072 RepID=UPI00307C4202
MNSRLSLVLYFALTLTIHFTTSTVDLCSSQIGLSEDVVECEEDSSLCMHGFCHNHRGGYECSCRSGMGYEPNEDKSMCIDIDECATQCKEHSLCENYEGGFNCSCEHGYYKAIPQMPVCWKVNYCTQKYNADGELETLNNDPCVGRENKQCVDHEDFYACECLDQYIPFDLHHHTGCVSVNSNLTFACVDTAEVNQFELDCSCDLAGLDGVTDMECHSSSEPSACNAKEEGSTCTEETKTNCSVAKWSSSEDNPFGLRDEFTCDCQRKISPVEQTAQNMITLNCFSDSFNGIAGDSVLMEINITVGYLSGSSVAPDSFIPEPNSNNNQGGLGNSVAVKCPAFAVLAIGFEIYAMRNLANCI